MYHQRPPFGQRETPQQYQARQQRVAIERAQRQAEKAQREAQRQAERSQREQAKSILDMAHTARTNRDYANAVQLYTNALNLKPEHKGAFLYRGQCYAHLQNNHAAYQDYKKALRIQDPMFKQAGALYGCLFKVCMRLAEELCSSNNHAQSVFYCREALAYTTKTDEQALCYYKQGSAFLKLGDCKQALGFLQQASALDRGQISYALMLSFCYKKLIHSVTSHLRQDYILVYRNFLQEMKQQWQKDDWVEDDLRWLDLIESSDNPVDFSSSFTAKSSLLNVRETVAHLDGGEVSFKSIGLNWSLNDINRVDELRPIKDRYRNATEYYETLIPLILEEAKASIRQYIEEPKDPFPLRVYKVKPSKKAQNPNKIIVSRNSRIPKEYLEMSQSCIALWLNCKLSDGRRVQGLGLASVVENETQIKTMITAEELRSIDTMDVSFLGSLVTFERMYSVCFEKPASRIVWKISSVLLQPWCSSNSTFNHDGLDSSQSRAINNFLVSPDDNLYLLQGPPGTGKTTTIVALLQMCIYQNLRVLVTAPSNKAIQELAIRLLQKAPEIKMMLAGVEEKTPDSLLPIFVHGWHKYYLEEIVNIVDRFIDQSFFISLLLLTPEKIKEDRLELLSGYDNLKKQVVKFYPQLEFILKNLGAILSDFTEILLGLSVDDLKLWNEYLSHEDRFLEPSQFGLYKSKVKKVKQALEALKIQLIDSEGNELRLLDQSQIIFSSLSVCGRQSLRRLQQGFDIVITDEAGQADPGALLVPSWFPTSKALYVGDPMQLPATTLSRTADQTRFAESTFARLIRLGAPYDMLDHQYRMHPDIRYFPSNQFYNGQLIDGINISIRENPLEQLYDFPFFPYGVVDVASGVESTAGKSRYNEKEIKAVEQLIKKINTKKSDAQIGVIAFYRAQVERLQQRFKKAKNVVVATVDGFQGGERDCIIISCVRANPHGNVGFAKDFRRANVAITRARHGLVIFGNIATLTREDHVLRDLIHDAQSRSKVISEEDFYKEVGKPAEDQKGKTKMKEFAAKEVKKGKSKKKEAVEKKEDNICWAFFKNGKCKFGDKCKYDHVRKEKGDDGSIDRLGL